jgi:hypothetical protein
MNLDINTSNSIRELGYSRIGRQVPRPAYCRIGGELQLGRELNLGVAGGSKAIKRAELVFQETPEINKEFFQEYANSKQRPIFPPQRNL